MKHKFLNVLAWAKGFVALILMIAGAYFVVGAGKSPLEAMDYLAPSLGNALLRTDGSCKVAVTCALNIVIVNRLHLVKQTNQADPRKSVSSFGGLVPNSFSYFWRLLCLALFLLHSAALLAATFVQNC
eukprot:5957653-Pleurochrysis_carterae.AAC.2